MGWRTGELQQNTTGYISSPVPQFATCFEFATYRKKLKNGGELANFNKTKYLTSMSTLKRKQTVSRARTGYQRQNEQAAGIILQDIARFGKEQAGLVIWARLIQANAAPKDAECGPLFRAAA
jgi:hypothetical protein